MPRVHDPLARPHAVRTASLAALLALSSVACYGGADRRPTRLIEVEQLTRDGDYERAARVSVELLDDLSEGSRWYDEALEAKRNVSLASGLERARSLLLADRNDEALELLETLDAAHPGQLPVEMWLDRARKKLADVWFHEARSLQASENFVEARDAYIKTLTFDPEHELAPRSLEDLQRVVEHRAQLAKDYYNDGVRSLTDEELAEAAWNFGKVPKFDRENDRARRRLSEVKRVQARERVQLAERLVGEHRYAAAAKEYSAAADLWPESDEIAAKVEAMSIEARADQLLGEGRFMLLRGEIDRGEGILREGLELTTIQKERFAEALTEVEDARTQKAYQLALDMEHDFRYVEAIEGYAAILESRDFYKDTRTRIETLRGYVEDAERLYDEASEAGTDDEALRLLRQIEVFWPEYRDIPEKIGRLSRVVGTSGS